MQKIILIFSFVIFWSCDQEKGRPINQQEPDYRKLKHVVDSLSQKRKFNASIGSETHLAIPFFIKNGNILDTLDIISYKWVKILRGPMPRMRRSGDFQVIIKKGNSVDTTFYMPNPLYYRVETGATRGKIRVTNGTFFVPIPRKPTISTIILLEEGKDSVKVNLNPQLMTKLKAKLNAKRIDQ